MRSLRIFFRCCLPVESLNKNIDRPFGLKKRDLILKSLKSLLESCSEVKNKIKFNIIDDSSGEEFIKELERLMNNYPFEYKIHKNKFKNNGLSLKETFKLAEKAKEDIFYFCEDDYIHLKETIPEIITLYEEKPFNKKYFGVFPADDPGRYIYVQPTYLFLGKNRYWRTTINTTCTFFINKKIFHKFKENFFGLAEFNIKGWGGENEYLVPLWKKIPCFVPVNSLTAHIETKDTLPLFIDWKKIIERIKIN